MVKFNRQHGSYNKGEVAKFSDHHEQWLTKKGIASPHKAKEPDVAKSAGTEKEQTPPAGQQPPPQGPQTRQTTVGPQRGR